MKDMKEKKAHGVQLLIRTIVRDPDGKVITDTGRKPSRSFLIQFLEFIYRMFNFVGSYDATGTGGTEVKIYVYNDLCQEHFRVDAALNAGTYGIVVGTGDTAVTNTDYKLETKIAQGEGAGEFIHGSGTVETAAEVGDNVEFIVKRTFTNLSGGQITVTEAGIYTKSATSYIHCIIRDVLGAGIDVPDKCSLTVIYTVRTTV